LVTPLTMSKSSAYLTSAIPKISGQIDFDRRESNYASS